jgi:hypothetical protein
MPLFTLYQDAKAVGHDHLAIRFPLPVINSRYEQGKT